MNKGRFWTSRKINSPNLVGLDAEPKVWVLKREPPELGKKNGHVVEVGVDKGGY